MLFISKLNCELGTTDPVIPGQEVQVRRRKGQLTFGK